MPAGQVTPYDRRRSAARYSGAIATYKRLTQAAAELTRQMKQRGIFPKTSLERKGIGMRGSRKGRRIPAMRTDARLSNVEGGYAQFTQDNIRSGRKKRTTLSRLTREVRSKAETAIYRFGAAGMFDDQGSYWCGKVADTAGTRIRAPCYIMDLSSVINTVPGGTVDAGEPLKQLAFDNATGRAEYITNAGLSFDGVTANNGWQLEKSTSSTQTLYAPHEKSRLLWTDLKMVLWGAKGKAVKFTVQIVKLKRDHLDPWKYDFATTPSGTLTDNEHQAFWQALTKSYMYSPIATTGSQIGKYFKVLKSYSTIIQPTSLDELDSDPHSKVLKWFMRWDRDFSYKENLNYIGTATDLANQLDYVQQMARTSPYTNTRSKLFLLVRATAYTSQTDTPTNSVQPSFDLIVRNCHVPQ